MVVFPPFPVVLSLVGLPGSGKTSFARWLHSYIRDMDVDGLSSTHAALYLVCRGCIYRDARELCSSSC